jgi:hypothetical protein
MRVSIWGLAIAMVLWGLASDNAHAQDVGASIAPTIIEDQLDPGETLSGTLSVSNVSDVPQTYYLRVRNVEGVDETGQPTFSDTGTGNGFTLSEWVTLDRDEVTIGPNQSVTIAYTISVPAGATPGGHFGGIFADRNPDPFVGQGAGVGYQVGALLSIQIAGDVVEDVQIREFATGKAVYTDPIIDFLVKVTNNGTVIARPVGFIEVFNMLGTKVGTVNVNEGGTGAALPGADRLYTAEWAGEGFHFGRYEAVVSLSYGSQMRSTISRTHTFWIVPMKELAIVLGGFLALLIAAYLGVRSYIRRELRKAGHTKSRSVAAQSTFAAKVSKVLITLALVTLVAIACIVLFFS